MTQEPLLRRLGTREAIALVVGTVIGTGVFLKAAVMSQATGSPGWVMAAWAVAGVLSLAGALCYAELGALFPRAGGEYVYLREAYGDLAGFLYGWMRFWIGTPASVAAYGVATAAFLNGAVKLGGSGAELGVALFVIIFFSLLNCFAVVVGGRFQAAMTVLKLFMILGLTIAIFTAADGASWSHLGESADGGGWRGFSAFGTAMLAALWAYDGWNSMPMAAGEIKDPGKAIPRALVFGMIAVFGIYALVNLAYFYALPFQEVLTARSPGNKEALAVGAKAALAAFGPVALVILSIAFVCSAIGSMNGSILTGARVPFAMARDGLFFKKLGEVGHTSRSPVVSLLVQCVIACALALQGSFDQLTDYVVFASWIFYALVTASIFVFRKRLPNADRPYRVPGYPWLPAIFILTSLLLLANTIYTSPKDCAIGLGFILAGIPVYYWFKKVPGS